MQLQIGFQQISNAVLNQDILNPEPRNIGSIPQCTERNGFRCYNMLYAPKNVTWVDNLMREVSTFVGSVTNNWLNDTRSSQQ